MSEICFILAGFTALVGACLVLDRKEPSGCEDSDFPYYRSLYNPPRSWYHPGLMNKIS